MSSLEEITTDLIVLYIKENYKKYLEENEIDKIEIDKIRGVVEELYNKKKDHLKIFLKQSLKELLKDRHPGDLTINTMIMTIFEDDELCINRLILEIKIYQMVNFIYVEFITQSILNGKTTHYKTC